MNTAPESHLEFIYTPLFESAAKDVLDEEQRRSLENVLLEHPEAGAVVVGTGGLRKLRFALPGRGKSGGVRVLYFYAAHAAAVYFILVYPKNVRDSLTQGEKNALRAYLETL